MSKTLEQFLMTDFMRSNKSETLKEQFSPREKIFISKALSLLKTAQAEIDKLVARQHAEAKPIASKLSELSKEIQKLK